MTDNTNHSQRAHSLRGFSGANRWMHCTAMPDFQEGLEEEGKLAPQKPSKAADRGTMCHEVTEELLTDKRKKVGRFIGDKELNGMKFNQEMADAVTEVVDHVRPLLHDMKGFDWDYETRIGPVERYGDDVWGTCDLSGYRKKTKTLAVADFKFGNKKVSAIGNEQILTTCAVKVEELKEDGFEVENILIAIFQPGNLNGDNGQFHKVDMFQFEVFKNDMEGAVKSEAVKFDPDETRCFFCPCRPHCKEYHESRVKLEFADVKQAEIEPKSVEATPSEIEKNPFEETSVAPLTSINLPAPADVPNNMVANILVFKKAFDTWYKDFITVKQAQREQDVEMEGTKLVAGRKGNRSWAKSEEEIMEILKNSLMFRDNQIMTSRLMSVAEFIKTYPDFENFLKEHKMIKQSEGKAVLALSDDKRKDYSLEFLFSEVN